MPTPTAESQVVVVVDNRKAIALILQRKCAVSEYLYLTLRGCPTEAFVKLLKHMIARPFTRAEKHQ